MVDVGFVREGAAWAEVPKGLPLLIALAGFRDPGSAVAQVVEAAGADHDPEDEPEVVVATFDPDELFDYRARRPVVEVDGGRMVALETPGLVLSLRHDALGQPFLLLAGFEPDFRWRAFTDVLRDLVAEFDIASTTWVQSVAMPVPHTRPIRLSAVGNRADLVERLAVWTPHTQAPALAVHQLAFALARDGHPVLGLVALVPHYVAEVPVPGGAVALLEALTEATGIVLATDGLRDAEREFRRGVDEQIAGNDEVVTLIAALEQQHDAYLKDLPDGSRLAASEGELPDAEEIAGELERFLATRPDDDA